MEKPNYYAILPAKVRYDKVLSPMARLLYAEITALTSKEGYCWAKNSYFSALYEVSEKTVTTWVKSLEKSGYIFVTYDYKKCEKDDLGNLTNNAVYKQRKIFIDESVYKVYSDDVTNKNVTNKNVTNKNVTNKNVTTRVTQDIINNTRKDINNTSNSNLAKSKEIKPLSKKPTKKEKYLERLDKIMLEYDFSENLENEIIKFFEDKIQKGIYEGDNYIRGQFEQLSKLSDKDAIACVKKSTTNGYKGMFYEDKPQQKQKRKFDDGVSKRTESITEEERVKKMAEIGLTRVTMHNIVDYLESVGDE